MPIHFAPRDPEIYDDPQSVGDRYDRKSKKRPKGLDLLRAKIHQTEVKNVVAMFVDIVRRCKIFDEETIQSIR
jgi:hypothetical protein